MRAYLSIVVVASAALLAAVGCVTPPAAAPAPAAPTSASVGATTIVAVQAAPAAAAPKQTLGEFLGVRHVLEGACGVGNHILSKLGMYFPGLEPKPPLLPITDPKNLESPNPAVKAAAGVKADEDAAEQKIKAIRYLATIGCAGCYPDVEAALLAALDDCTEAVRYEAAEALRGAAGRPCKSCRASSCCGPKVLKKLDDIAYGTKDDGCFKEPSARVRRVARLAMSACGGAPPADTPAEQLPTEGPSAPEEGPPPTPPGDPVAKAKTPAARTLAAKTPAAKPLPTNSVAVAPQRPVAPQRAPAPQMAAAPQRIAAPRPKLNAPVSRSVAPSTPASSNPAPVAPPASTQIAAAPVAPITVPEKKLIPAQAPTPLKSVLKQPQPRIDVAQRPMQPRPQIEAPRPTQPQARTLEPARPATNQPAPAKPPEAHKGIRAVDKVDRVTSDQPVPGPISLPPLRHMPEHRRLTVSAGPPQPTTVEEPSAPATPSEEQVTQVPVAPVEIATIENAPVETAPIETAIAATAVEAATPPAEPMHQELAAQPSPNLEQIEVPVATPELADAPAQLMHLPAPEVRAPAEVTALPGYPESLPSHSALALDNVGPTEAAQVDAGPAHVEPVVQQVPLAEVIASVNGDPITEPELAAAVESRLRELVASISPEQAETLRPFIVRRELGRIIDRKLLCQQARGVALPEGVSRASYLEHHHGAGLTLQAPIPNEDSISREEAMAAEWLAASARADQQVTDEEIVAYYRAHAHNYERPGEVCGERLTARFDRFTSKAEAHAALFCARDHLLGIDTSGTAAGIEAIEFQPIEWLCPTDLPSKTLGDALGRLAVGTFSAVLEGDAGLHIIRVTDRRPPSYVPVEEVATQIQDEIIAVRQAQVEQAYLEYLRSRAGIWAAIELGSGPQQASTWNQGSEAVGR